MENSAKAIHLRELATGREKVGFGKHAEVTSLALFYDGGLLALGANENFQIELYDTQTEKLIATFVGHESKVGTLAFLPDSSRLASGSWDHTVKLWDPQSGQQLLSLPMGPDLDERVEHILVSPDGSRIVATDGRSTLLVWKSQNRRIFRPEALRTIDCYVRQDKGTGGEWKQRLPCPKREIFDARGFSSAASSSF